MSARELSNLQAAKRANELWNARRVDEYVATLASDHVFRSVALPEPIVGPEAYRAFLAEAFRAMPDWQISEPQESSFGAALSPPAYAQGGFVTMPSLNHGSRISGFLGLPPMNRPWSFFSCTIYQYRDDGRVQATWAYWNPINVLEDLGIDPRGTFHSGQPDIHAGHTRPAEPSFAMGAAPRLDFHWGDHAPAPRAFDASETLRDVLIDVIRLPFRVGLEMFCWLVGEKSFRSFE
ncbi:MAG: ester cyclase [Acidobacteriota bacterium]